MVPAMDVGSGDEDFKRGIARPRPHAGEAGIDTDRAVLDRDDAVRDAEAEIVVGMDPALGLGFSTRS